MSEEEVIKRRLTFDGDGTGEDRRLNVMVKMISKWINTTDETPEEAQSMYNKISAQLAHVRHSRHRSDLVRKQNAKQLRNYKDLHSNMEKHIAEKKKEIAKQKNELEKAKIIKQNKIQYDLVAKEFNEQSERLKMLKNLVDRWITSSTITPEEEEVLYNKVLEFLTGAEKSNLSSDTKDPTSSKPCEEMVGEIITKLKEEIARQKDNLQKVKRIEEVKILCELLVEKIEKEETEDGSSKELTPLADELLALRAVNYDLEGRMKRKEEQLALFNTCADFLILEWSDDEEITDESKESSPASPATEPPSE